MSRKGQAALGLRICFSQTRERRCRTQQLTAAAGNLNFRTNNALVQAFGVNSLNELTALTRSGTLTVEGTATSVATNVTVNTLPATLYADGAFARTNLVLVNGATNYTAIAKDLYGRFDTNTVAVTLAATNNYRYDLNGNLLTDGRRAFDYDDENQLIRVTVTNAWKSEFVYDGKMRRRIRREYSWNGGAWAETNEVRYVYDGNLVIQERDTNSVPLVTYTRGRDLSGTMQGAGGIGGLLARTDNAQMLAGNTYYVHAYYHADGNGNVTFLINSNQVMVARYEYDPFGNILSQTGPLADANLYRFSSKELHLNSGLVYYLYRFYDASLQRWVSRDPINEMGGLNLYAYVANTPLYSYDAVGYSIAGNNPNWPPIKLPPGGPGPTPPSGGAQGNMAAAALFAAIQAAVQAHFTSCQNKSKCPGPDGQSDCEKCCNNTAYTGIAADAGAAATGAIACAAWVVPLKVAACLVATAALNEAADLGILDAQKACLQACHSKSK